MFDVLVIGSGPAGVQALAGLSRKGLRLGLIEPGKVEERYSELIPEEPFAEIRRSCRHQQRFLLGDYDEALAPKGTQLAAHLTPPRQYLLEGTERHLPFRSETLSHFQTLARGGLGAGWGAGACTFSPGEMKEVGIDPAVMAGCYSRVAQSIGLSLDPEDHAAALVCDLAGAQPPLQVDENAEALLASYRRKSKPLNENGFFLGKAPLAVLPRDRERAGILRRACSYHNMDYYSDHGGAVYRPSHTLAELRNEREFEHLRGYLALEFSEKDGRLAVLCRSLADGETMTFQARRVVLAAGALNSARLVLASCRKFGRQLPLLSNEVRFLAVLESVHAGKAPEELQVQPGPVGGGVVPVQRRPADQLFLLLRFAAALSAGA